MTQFYHVVVSTNAESDIVLFKNLSKNELRNKFIHKFKSGKNLFVDKQIFKCTEFLKVNIIETGQSLEEELEQYHQESLEWLEKAKNEPGPTILPCGRGIYENEIIERGSDVTEDFIFAPPSSSGNIFSRFLHNPWTIKIAGGVIVALIIWWLTNHFNLFS